MAAPIKKLDAQWYVKLLSPQESKRVIGAISLIGPAAELRSRCEYFVVWTVTEISFFQKIEAGPSAAVAKDAHLKKAKRLRQAAAVFEGFFLNGSANHLPVGEAARQVIAVAKNWADHFENIGTSIRVSKGARFKKPSKSFATDYGWCQLMEFGSQPPSLTEDGLWHQLVEALCGCRVIDYLRNAHKRLKNSDHPDPLEFIVHL
jgi:hypothetical protein